MITRDLVQRLRRRGLFLSIKETDEYESDRLRYIVLRQEEISKELNLLDEELFKECLICVEDEKMAGS